MPIGPLSSRESLVHVTEGVTADVAPRVETAREVVTRAVGAPTNDDFNQSLSQTGPDLGTDATARPSGIVAGGEDPVGGEDPTDPQNPRLIPERKTDWDALHNPDFFNESQTYQGVATADLVAQGPSVLANRRTQTSMLTSGFMGRLMAARFVNRGQRQDGDFRYAYGPEAYRAFRAGDALLRNIPEGQLSASLNLELMAELSRLTYTPEDNFKVGQFMADLRRGGHAPRPGELRKDQAATRPIELTHEQYEALAGNENSLLGFHEGAALKQRILRSAKKVITSPKAFARFRRDLNERIPDVEGSIVYAKAKDVKPELEELIRDTQKGLDDPQSDIIEVAAHFAQRFAAIHPFEEGNGRISRLVMDRILAERGLPAPILSEMDNDVTATHAGFKDAVAQGVRRSLSQSPSYTGGAHGYASRLFQSYGVPLQANAAAPRIKLGDEEFTIGDEGFVYNEAGRPHLVGEDGKLQALPQLNYYLAIRRLAQSEDPQAALEAYTGKTRAAFQKLVDFPLRQKFTTQPADEAAMAADNKYHAQFGKTGNEDFVGLFDPSRSSAEKLFVLRQNGALTQPPRDGVLGDAISRYQIIDLDLWHAEQGLLRSGDKQGAKAMHAHREQLFTLAKQFLDAQKNPSFVSETNPLGFKTNDEQIEFERSPLRFDSLAQAIKKQGDDSLYTWRGDIAAARFIGMGPDNIPGKPDAFKIADFRAEHGGVVNLFDDLNSLEGSAVGSGYQSSTARLRLLSRDSSFASSANQTNLDLTALPPKFAAFLNARLGGEGSTVSINTPQDVLALFLASRHTPKGYVDVSGLSPKQLELAFKSGWQDPALEPARERLKAAVADRADANVAERFLDAVSDRPKLVKVDDLGLNDWQLSNLRGQVGLMRDYFTLTPSADGKSLGVSAQRRAFLMKVDKQHALPGINALGGTFENEQEIHLLANERPTAFKQAYGQPELQDDLPQIIPDPVVPPAPPVQPEVAQTSDVVSDVASSTPVTSETPEVVSDVASTTEPVTADAASTESVAASEPAPEVVSDWATQGQGVSEPAPQTEG